MSREPARIIAAIEALLTLLVAFGVWQVTDVQIEAILVFAGAVLTLIVGGAAAVRRIVWSPAGHEREVVHRVAEAVEAEFADGHPVDPSSDA